jgi:hypothetical protein
MPITRRTDLIRLFPLRRVTSVDSPDRRTWLAVLGQDSSIAWKHLPHPECPLTFWLLSIRIKIQPNFGGFITPDGTGAAKVRGNKTLRCSFRGLTRANLPAQSTREATESTPPIRETMSGNWGPDRILAFADELGFKSRLARSFIRDEKWANRRMPPLSRSVRYRTGPNPRLNQNGGFNSAESRGTDIKFPTCLEQIPRTHESAFPGKGAAIGRC